MSTKENINVREYFYKEGENIKIDGRILLDFMNLLDSLVEKEIKVESKFKYNYVDENNNIVKNVTKNNVDKLSKIVDVDRTIMNPSLEYSITDKGIEYTKLKNFLEGIHHSNIKEGIAVHYKELMKQAEPNS